MIRIGRAVALPADRRLRVPLRLPHRALISPDGGFDWLCVPSFDSPSVIGASLVRRAAVFRLAPFKIDHPTPRA